MRAEGITELKNAAIEPEIMDLIAILQKMGAIISVEPNRVILIEGVDTPRRLHAPRALRPQRGRQLGLRRARHRAATSSSAARKQQEMMTFLNVFRKVGGAFDIHDDGIRFYHPGGELKPVVIETDVHPGFMTDWQQPLIVALTQATASRSCTRPSTRDRFGFTDALVEMGADIEVHKDGLERSTRAASASARWSRGADSAGLGGERRASSSRPRHHRPDRAPTSRSPDLRGGFSHLIAALTAEGRSTVSNVGIISRGYETSSPSSRSSEPTSPSRL